jgi:hypothetical protein
VPLTGRLYELKREPGGSRKGTRGLLYGSVQGDGTCWRESTGKMSGRSKILVLLRVSRRPASCIEQPPKRHVQHDRNHQESRRQELLLKLLFSRLFDEQTAQNSNFWFSRCSVDDIPCMVDSNGHGCAVRLQADQSSNSAKNAPLIL